MPEYLAPGVVIEETSFRSKSIEGVSTSVTGFVGPTRYGPVVGEGELLSSIGDFERAYGDRQQLRLGGSTRHNYMWHAARAFFEEGGKRLHVSRVFRRIDDSPARQAPYLGLDETCTQVPYADGHSRARLGEGGPGQGGGFEVLARYPGLAGSVQVRFTFTVASNVLVVRAVIGVDRRGRRVETAVLEAKGLRPRDVVLVSRHPSAPGWGAAQGPFYLASQEAGGWAFTDDSSDPGRRFLLSQITPPEARAGLEIRVVSVDVFVEPIAGAGPILEWRGLALDRGHEVEGNRDSLDARFEHEPAEQGRNRNIPILVRDAIHRDGLGVLRAFLQAGASRVVPLEAAIPANGSSAESRSVSLELEGGNDGQEPMASDFDGQETPDSGRSTGLKQFEAIQDIAIVAAPGSSYSESGPTGLGIAGDVAQLLISHCERMRYRIALLDSGNGMTIADVRSWRAKFDSKHAALYYPWILVTDPSTGQVIPLPPSGFVAGIYARTDAERAVFKAPANEVVRLAVGFETTVTAAQQEVLNPEGINAFRFFEGRGNRLWGARTISSDPEWKYVNLRRYFAYLERSIDQGTQWAVFEPNGEALWGNIRVAIENFLMSEWKRGGFLGDKPEKAYFVRCDRSTMTQNDLDNGRLVCLVGVAPLKPAEFVIFRIGQWTADHK